MRRRFEYKERELEDFLIRFYPAGNYTWIVPDGCFLVDVFFSWRRRRRQILYGLCRSRR